MSELHEKPEREIADLVQLVLPSGKAISVDIQVCSSVAELRHYAASALGTSSFRVRLVAGQRILNSTEALDVLVGLDIVQVVLVPGPPTLYVAETGNKRVSRWELGAPWSHQVVAGWGADAGEGALTRPKGICVDADAVYVADESEGTISRWPFGLSTREVVMEGLKGPCGICMDTAGRLYVAERFAHRVTRWAPGASEGIVVAGGTSKDELEYPAGLCLSSEGSLFVAETGNQRVTRWEPGETRGTVVAGGHGGGSALYQLDHPFGVAVDGEGALYVAEVNNHRVTRWARGADRGEIVAGGRGSGPGAQQLCGPTAVAVDGEGSLYVVENQGHRVTYWARGVDHGVVVARAPDPEIESGLKHPVSICLT